MATLSVHVKDHRKNKQDILQKMENCTYCNMYSLIKISVTDLLILNVNDSTAELTQCRMRWKDNTNDKKVKIWKVVVMDY
jgi:hypothetical protein